MKKLNAVESIDKPTQEPKNTTLLESTMDQVLSEKYMGFKKVAAAAKKGGAKDPEAVAASVGREKYGKEKFQKAAAAGKKLGENVKLNEKMYFDPATGQTQDRTFKPQSLPQSNTADSEQFKADINTAKSGLEWDPDKKQVFTTVRGLGPGMAADRLEKRGVDIPGLIGNRVRQDTLDREMNEDDMEEGNKFTGNLAKARAKGLKKADLDGDGDMETVKEEKKETKTGAIHKAKPGRYGGYDPETDPDKDDDEKKAEPAKKRGRGRPKKGADSDTGEVKKWDTDTLQSWIVGNKPKTLPGKASVKHKMKDESVKKGVAEGKSSMEYVSFNKNEFKTWEYYANMEGYEIRDSGGLYGSYIAFDKNGKKVGYFYNEYDLPNGEHPIGKLLVDTSVEYPLQGVAEGSNDLYQKAIRKYAQQVANDYLNGGNEHLYGANKFDAEMFGVSQEKANKDFKTWFTMIIRSQAVRPRQDVSEVAPPGAKAERMVKHIKQGYAKDGKVTPKEKGIAYATAWKAHNKGKVEESIPPNFPRSLAKKIYEHYDGDVNSTLEKMWEIHNTVMENAAPSKKKINESMSFEQATTKPANKPVVGTYKDGVWTADPPKKGEVGVPVPQNIDGGSAPPSKPVKPAKPQKKAEAGSTDDSGLAEMLNLAGIKKSVSESEIAECGMSPIAGQDSMTNTEGRMSINTNMSTDGNKTVTISADGDAAVELMKMLKMAGMNAIDGSEDTDIEKMSEEKDERYEANTTPEEEVLPVQTQLKGGNGELAGKEKKMTPHGYKFADNPLAMNESMSLKLLKEYESIKK